MRHLLQALACAAILSTTHAQESPSLPDALSFETEHTGRIPAGWNGYPPQSIFLDDKVVHSGKWAVRVEREADTPADFSGITKSLPVDFKGATIQLRGFIRMENVNDFVALWMREDGENPRLPRLYVPPATHSWWAALPRAPTATFRRSLLLGLAEHIAVSCFRCFLPPAAE
jgi:hypothetical protein